MFFSPRQVPRLEHFSEELRLQLQLLPEYFFQQGGSLRGGVVANLLLFLTQHQQESVQSFLDDVVVEIELLTPE